MKRLIALGDGWVDPQAVIAVLPASGTRVKVILANESLMATVSGDLIQEHGSAVAAVVRLVLEGCDPLDGFLP